MPECRSSVFWLLSSNFTSLYVERSRVGGHSDVVHGILHAQHEVDLAAARQAVGQLHVELIQSNIALRSGVLERHGLLIHPDSESGGRQQVAEACTEKLHDHGVGRPYAEGLRRATRSEEHPSELQSRL